MICSFFKFSILEHFWAVKLIAWVDIRVVLIFYSFRASGLIWRKNLKNEQNIPKLQNVQNLRNPTLTAYICGKIDPHPYVRGGTDSLFL